MGPNNLGSSQSPLVSSNALEDRYHNLLSILENEFTFEEKVKCLRFLFDKMIEWRQVQIKEHEEITQNLMKEVITIRRHFEVIYDEPTEPILKQHG